MKEELEDYFPELEKQVGPLKEPTEIRINENSGIN